MLHKPARVKILVIFSWDDDTSARRHELMRSDSRLAKYDFEQAFAVPSPKTRPEARLLAIRISEAIDEFKPDVLLLHTGAAFHRAPHEFATCTREIQRRYSYLRFGYERRATTAAFDDLDIFEQSDEMDLIEQDFF
jgi:hypothetical protein